MDCPLHLCSLGSLADLDDDTESFHLEEEAPNEEPAGTKEAAAQQRCAPQAPPSGEVEVETLRRRNAALQSALAETHMRASKQVLLFQQQIQVRGVRSARLSQRRSVHDRLWTPPPAPAGRPERTAKGKKLQPATRRRRC